MHSWLQGIDAAESADIEADPVSSVSMQTAYTRKVVNVLESIVV